MKLQSFLRLVGVFGVVLGGFAAVRAQAPAAQAGPAETAQSQAASEGKYCFLIFYRDDNEPTRAMSQAVKDLVAKRNDAAAIEVQVANPADAEFVRRFDVSRAPMPLLIVTAPNGAVTAAMPQRVTNEQLAAAFVTPAMSQCMKSMQQGRLVFLHVQSTAQAGVPQGVADFAADPQFQGRCDVVTVKAGDPSEATLLQEIAGDKNGPGVPSVVFFAPPGVLVGKFDGKIGKGQLATALHNAGKCCDDPNCKHGGAQRPNSKVVR